MLQSLRECPHLIAPCVVFIGALQSFVVYAFLATLLYLCGCGVPISYSHVLRFLVVMWMLSIGSLVDPNMCFFIMGLSAQSVVWGCGVCAAIEYALLLCCTIKTSTKHCCVWWFINITGYTRNRMHTPIIKGEISVLFLWSQVSDI
jgi:hypothetical protein